MVTAESEAPPAAVRDLLATSIGEWYPRCSAHTFRSVIIELDEEFVRWLVSDGVAAAGGNRAFGSRKRELGDDDWSSEEEDDGDDEDAEEEDSCAPFPELVARIEEAIRSLGGRVVPKLTWSCPKDAVWLMHDNTMSCTTADEVMLLLKSSDRVAHDVAEALPAIAAAAGFEGECPKPRHVLALREWETILPDREFRCFVVDNVLRGISQRDVTSRYESLQNDATRLQIRDWIEAFVRRVLLRRVALPSFVADVVVGPTGRVKLVDVNPSGGTTAPLLFTWEELLGEETDAGDEAEDAGGAAQAAAKEPTAREAPAESASSDEPRSAPAEPASSDEPRSAQEPLPVPLARPGAPTRHPRDCDCCSPPVAGSMPLCEIRVVTEAGAMQPNVAIYGVPYDFVDASEGSAMNQLLEQFERAEGLWKNLSAQANANP